MHKQLLKQLQANHQLTDDDVTKITERFKFSSAKKKAIILDLNKPSDKILFINKGAVRAYFINHKGDPITRMIASEDCFLTNMISFRNLGDNTEIFECLEDTAYLYISKPHLLELLEYSNQIRVCYYKLLEFNYALQTMHIHVVTNSDACAKMQYLKTNFPNLIGRISDQILASFIGLSRETLVRNKAHLL
jgi:signal-transduction protein with cAMP-binding, CBS, and nucleotidyltransferase domain